MAAEPQIAAASGLGDEVLHRSERDQQQVSLGHGATRKGRCRPGPLPSTALRKLSRICEDPSQGAASSLATARSAADNAARKSAAEPATAPRARFSCRTTTTRPGG